MSSSTQVILLERVEKLGQLGDVVNVKPGFARNYLLPQKKALRASKENIAYFEAQRKTIEADNNAKKKEAEKSAKKISGIKVPLIRQASESGQLFGSVNARDIANAVQETSKEAVTRSMVRLNQNIKTIGLIDIDITLHPEVTVQVTANIARSAEEAKIQAETGRALVADASADDVEEPEEEVLEAEGETAGESETSESNTDEAA